MDHFKTSCPRIVLFCISSYSSLKTILYIVCLFCSLIGRAQSLSGFVYDEENTPVPFADVYIKNLQTGTKTDINGAYFLRFKDFGSYDIVIRSTGFNDTEFSIVMEENKTLKKNIWLVSDATELDQLVVSSKGKDPAYEIIQKAIQKRAHWQSQISSSTCKVYIKATELIDPKESNRRKKEQEIQDLNTGTENPDLLEKQKKEQSKKIAGSMNMLEVNLDRHYQRPNKIKEVRIGVKKYGDNYGLFFKNTIENNFDFYAGLLTLNKLNDVPLISPLNKISVLSYKFKLVDTEFLNGKMLFKIKVTPRKKGNSTFRGHIWILDDAFSLMKVDLSLKKGGLIVFDKFRVEQSYSFSTDSTLILDKQHFTYESSTKRKKFKGETVVTYSNYQLGVDFPNKFFSNELGVTTKEAYKRDSSYWDNIRPKPLTKKEQRFQQVKDSLYKYTHSEPYLDSMDSVYNIVTPLNVLWDGVFFSNRKKKVYWGVSSLAGMIDPFEIAGIRFGPTFSYFKKYENEKYWRFDTQLNTSYQNWDLKGYVSLDHRYDPFHRGVVSFYAGRQFDLVVMNDALSNLLERNNWIENDFIYLGHRRELINGLMFGTSIHLNERRSIEKYNFSPLLDSAFDKPNNVTPFQTYQGNVVSLSLAYTPAQKYMREPNRKVVLGSDWPTFALTYQKGLPGFLGSDINFDYLEAEINQSFKLRTLGTSSYKITGGQFLNTADLRYIDRKIFPRGDQWFFASLMQSMQIQDTTLTVTNSFFKAHYTHHFNGAIINFVPLIKKLGLHVAAGTSTLFIPESNYRYLEAFVGIERTFKIERRRLRIGIFGVEGTSNYSAIQPRMKFAINFYSLRDNSWGY